MRRALELPDGYIPKTIRHTVTTELRRRGLPAEQISVFLGHRSADMERMTAVYAKYDPRYLADAVSALQALLTEVNQKSRSWSAGHHVVKIGNAPVAVIVVDNLEQQSSWMFLKAIQRQSRYRASVNYFHNVTMQKSERLLTRPNPIFG